MTKDKIDRSPGHTNHKIWFSRKLDKTSNNRWIRYPDIIQDQHMAGVKPYSCPHTNLFCLSWSHVVNVKHKKLYTTKVPAIWQTNLDKDTIHADHPRIAHNTPPYIKRCLIVRTNSYKGKQNNRHIKVLKSKVYGKFSINFRLMRV